MCSSAVEVTGAGLCKQPSECCSCNTCTETVEVLSETHCFSFHFLVRNYQIISQSKQDDFAVLKFYLISLLGGCADRA